MMKNKSTLAKLLAEEDIFVVHKQMETAYFNPKSRELGLPIWKDEDMTKDIYDLMVCHEIGHALWTPLDMLEKAQIRKINHSFVNIIEDARIETRVKSKYPGAIGVFNRGYVDLVKRDFFGTVDKDINSFNLIDRINIFFKSADKNISFSDEEQVLVDRVTSCTTPDHVLDLAEEIYAWMGENESETDNYDVPFGMPGESDESGESDDSDGSGENGESGDKNDDGNSDGSDDDADDGESGNDTSKGKSSETGEDGDENESSAGKSSDENTDENDVNSSSDEASDEVGGKESTGKGGPPEAKTDGASDKVMDALRDKTAEDRIYARIPKIDTKEIILSYKDVLDEFVPWYLKQKSENSSLYWNKTLEEIETLKLDSKKTVAYMVKEFEMKKAADQYARAATSKTGSLDMSKLHTYKYEEDLFQKVTTLPGATNHGLVMVLDWSGSMNENLTGTLSQMYNLIWFCRRTKIPFEVFAFSDRYGLDRRSALRQSGLLESAANTFKAGDIALNRFKLLNFFSSNMTITEEMDMMHILWMYAARYARYRDWSKHGYPYSSPGNLELGGTPLNAAIIAMMDIVPQFKKDTGVQKVNTVFLTDGASHHLEGIFDYKLNKETGDHTESIISFGTMWRTSFKGNKYIITDPVMNKTYECESQRKLTNDLLQILKNRVDGMNIIGFFIAGSGRKGKVSRHTLQYLLDSNEVANGIKFLNKNKYLAIKQLGYDEYYILPGGSDLKPENETLDDDLVGASKAKLKSAFGKMSKGKISSRQLLNKFVTLVA